MLQYLMELKTDFDINTSVDHCATLAAASIAPQLPPSNIRCAGAFPTLRHHQQQQQQQQHSHNNHHHYQQEQQYSNSLTGVDGLVSVAQTVVKEERDMLSPCRNSNGSSNGCSSMVMAAVSANSYGQGATMLNTNMNSTQDDWSSSSPPGRMSVDSSPLGNDNPNYLQTEFSPISSCNTFPNYTSNGREDMSPPCSINGNTMDGFRENRRNRGPTSRQQEELCLVCGDRASGYHYNALTCEGCKGFFRRSITKNAVYECKYGKICDIDMYMRRKCQECRLKKCLKVGMRPECVVPEYQCAVKREAKRAQKEKDKPNSTTKECMVVSPDPQKEEPKEPRMIRMGLTAEEDELIERLVFFQEEFEAPSHEDLEKITCFPISGDDGESRYKHITEITIYTVQLIVEFAKRVPWFDSLQREDQITLLKACSSEVMMLRTARRYDIQTESIVFANDQPYTKENYNSAGVGDSADALFHFCKQMCLLKVDNAEYALLTAIVLFSERPNLMEPGKVEKIQEIYLEALRKYVGIHRPKCPHMFARLLAVLTELRTLGNLNSEMCFSLKLKNKQLPPFLAEIWDINS